MRIKTLSFGFGSVISLILAYFIYLYANERGWKLLAFLSKAYLIVYIALIGVTIGIFGLIALLSFLMFRRAGKKFIKKEFIDAEYKVKE